MSTKEDFDLKIATIQAIPDDEIQVPNNIPLDTYVQEAENLFHWCQPDMAVLMEKGFQWETITDLPVRSGALREAESMWNLQRFTRKEASQQWAEESPAAYDLRDQLLHDFRFAYREDKNLLKKISDIASGYGHPDMIQDLNDLSLLGKTNPDPLIAITFDVVLLDEAATKADYLASLYGIVTGERAMYNDAKKVRDQAYTHLKVAVDHIYAFGQYVFWRNKDRRHGYRSNYLYRRWLKSEATRKAAADDAGSTGTEPPDSNISE